MVPVAFWTFRLMIGIGMLAAAVAAYYLWSTRKGRTTHGLVLRFLPLIPILPAAANTFGWIFTETARQPWLAFGISRVADGISPGLTRGEVLASLAGFAVVYGILAVVWLRLVRHLCRQPLAPAPAPAEPATEKIPAPVY
jgi:cytochrome d ubiquinol oxidase subunit I